MNLNELRDEAYSIAKANGWHEEEHNDSHWLMLIITEIAEAVQADRKVHHARVDKFIGDMSDKDNAEDYWYRLTFAQKRERVGCLYSQCRVPFRNGRIHRPHVFCLPATYGQNINSG